MPEICSKCGAQQGVGCDLIQEELLRRKYCPQCHALLVQRIYVFSYLFLGVLAAVGVAAALRSGENALESTMVSIGLLMLFQLLMTIPHELGHAFAARALRFQNIRILIGSGTPIWSGSFLNFRWIFNSIPFGGFTLSAHDPSISRFSHILIVAAGPATSAIPMILIWTFSASADAWPSMKSVPGIFFWSNAVVLLNNVIPHYVDTSLGRLPNDGLIILQLLFPSRFASPKEPRPKIRRVLVGILKTLALLGMALVTMLLALLAWFTLWRMTRDLGGFMPIVLGSFLVCLTIFAGYMTVRIARDPFNPPRDNTETDSPWELGMNELAATSAALNSQKVRDELSTFNLADPQNAIARTNELLAEFPGDTWLLFVKGQIQRQIKSFPEALNTFRSITASTPAAQFALILYQLDILLHREDLAAAENLAENFLASPASDEQKIALCEYIVCLPMYSELRGLLPHLEKWVHRALAISPGNPSVKATHGGLLVELGRYTEAEPLLIGRIEQAPNLHNRAFAMFYVGLIRAASGRKKDAIQLLEQSTILCDVPWLSTRVAKILQELKS